MRPYTIFLVLLVFVVGSSGRGFLVQADPEGKMPRILTAKPIKTAENDDELRKLLIARYNAAVAEMQARYQQYQNDPSVTGEAFYGVARRLGEAGMELRDKPADQVSMCEELLELQKYFVKHAEAKFEAGLIGRADLERARYQRIDAEIHLLRAQRKVKAAQQ